RQFRVSMKLNRDTGIEIRESMTLDLSGIKSGIVFRTLENSAFSTETEKKLSDKIADTDLKYSIGSFTGTELKLEKSDEHSDFKKIGSGLVSKFYALKRTGPVNLKNEQVSLSRKSYGHIRNEKGQAYLLYPLSPLSGKTSFLKAVKAEVELPSGSETGEIQIIDSGTMQPALTAGKSVLRVGNKLSLEVNMPSLSGPLLLKTAVPQDSVDSSLIPEEVYAESVNIIVPESEIRILLGKDGVFYVTDSFQAKRANKNSSGSVIYRMAEEEPLVLNLPKHFQKQTFFDAEYSPKDLSYYSSSYYKSLTDIYISESLKKYEVRYRLYGNFYTESGKNHYIFTAPYTERNAVRKTRIVLDFADGMNVSDFEVSAERKTGPVRKEISGNSVIFSYGLDLGEDPALVRISVPTEKISGLSLSNRMKIWNEDGTFIVLGVSSAVLLLLTFLSFGVRKFFVSRRFSEGQKADLALRYPDLNEQKAVLKSLDPEFDENEFLEKVKRTFEKLTLAWISGNMKPARSIVSAGVFGRFRTQLEIMKEDGTVNVMKDWKIRDLKIISVQSSKNLFTVDVALSAEARDVNVSASLSQEERERLVSRADLQSYTEIWSFIRAKNAKTKKQSGLLFDSCPKCGSSAGNSADVNKCSYCGTIYNSGEYDWVLSEITQEEEWKSEDRTLPGFAEIQKLIPETGIQLIEDRASHLFWKWIEARRKGNVLPVKRFCTESFAERRFLKPEYISDPVIGAAVLQSCRMEDGKVFSRVFIQWSASFLKGTESVYQEVNLVLVRNISSEKDSFGFAELGCPSCGAPLPESDSVKCGYCRSDLPVQVNDWLLDSAM
ncbi:MAG TPA: zinc-ribbon domain-containing transport protein, partial [Leptospiraceae bacterium]|nr:zinc-ribbon domain-containing transport protein [Leptospiraceae bacterium]HNN06397.1 zinc-ribbon domain-containing transport protein [Leptospiraceae bacterium]